MAHFDWQTINIAIFAAASTLLWVRVRKTKTVARPVQQAAAAPVATAPAVKTKSHVQIQAEQLRAVVAYGTYTEMMTTAQETNMLEGEDYDRILRTYAIFAGWKE